MGEAPHVPQEACAYIDESGAKGFETHVGPFREGRSLVRRAARASLRPIVRRIREVPSRAAERAQGPPLDPQ